MQSTKFDSVARTFGSHNRRGIFAAFGVAIGGAAATRVQRVAATGGTCSKHIGEPCNDDNQCCDDNQTCGAVPGDTLHCCHPGKAGFHVQGPWDCCSGQVDFDGDCVPVGTTPDPDPDDDGDSDENNNSNENNNDIDINVGGKRRRRRKNRGGGGGRRKKRNKNGKQTNICTGTCSNT